MTTIVQTASVLPSLAGLGFDVDRSPEWSTNLNRSASGKKTSIRFWSSPLYQYDITYEFLRSGAIYTGDTANTEFQDLMGFFNSQHGRADPWLYDDPDDDSVTGQLLGTGTGSLATFQMVRTLGGFTEPILAPNVITAIYVDGVSISSSFWSVSAYGTATPGILTFTAGHEPAAGKLVTADFSWYWPCRFTEDILNFNKFMRRLWAVKKVSFETEK